MAINKILVPVDGSPYAQQAIEAAKSFAEKFDSEVILLHVIDNTNIYPRDLGDSIIKENRRLSSKILEKGKHLLDSLGEKVTTVQKQGVPYDVILSYSEEADVDLIVMGSRGTSGVNRILLGSVTRKVAVASEKSVYIVR